MAEHPNSRAEQGILIFIRQIQKRLALQRLLRYMAFYGAAGALFALGCNVLTLWIPIYAGMWMGFGGLGLLLLLGVVHWLCRWPKKSEAAFAGDQAGLEERLTTSLERWDKTDLMSQLQRQDTNDRIQNFPIAERIILRKYPKWYAGIGICIILSVFCALYPTEAKRQAKEQHALRVAQKEAVEQIDQAEQKLTDQAGEGKLQETEQKALRDILESAKKEIASSQSKADIQKAQNRLETKLMKALPEKMSTETAQNLQPLVQNQNLAAMAEYQQAIDNLAQNSETIAHAKQELQSLGEMLGTEQKEALIGLLNQAQSDGTITPQELSDALQSLNDANATYTQTQLSQQGNNQQSGSTAQAGTGSQQANGSAGGENNAQSSGSQQKGAEGSGQSGNGENSGSNPSGNGSGTGTGEGSEGNGNGSGSGGGSSGGGYNRGSEQGMERAEQAGEAEQVWIPQETGDDENLTGQKKGTSKAQRKSQTANTQNAGQKANLAAVSGSYEKKAYSKIKKQNIPDTMEDLVKEYFSSLD